MVDELHTGWKRWLPVVAPGKRLAVIGYACAALLGVFFLVVLYRNVRAVDSEKPWVYLSDLRPESVTQDWGLLERNRSVDRNPLTIGPVRFPKGLGTHANSRICYRLDRRYREFSAAVGVDAEVAARGGSVIFRVLGDGQVLYASPVVSGLREPLVIRLDVGSVDELCLVAADAGDGINSDHADWGGLRLAR